MTQKIFLIFAIYLMAATVHSMILDTVKLSENIITEHICFHTTCNFTCKTQDKLFHHIASKHSPEKQNSLHKHPTRPHKKFQCNLCNKILCSTSGLSMHKKNKHEQRRYYCNIGDCEKYFTYYCTTRMHRESVHNTTKYICYNYGCPQQFNSAPDLQSHTRQMHKLKTVQNNMHSSATSAIKNLQEEILANDLINYITSDHTMEGEIVSPQENIQE